MSSEPDLCHPFKQENGNATIAISSTVIKCKENPEKCLNFAFHKGLFGALVNFAISFSFIHKPVSKLMPNNHINIVLRPLHCIIMH